jgi:hypothetical protein
LRGGIPVAIVEGVSRQLRLLLAGGVVLAGLVAAVTLGGSVARCLGPLGVTGIQCAQASGWYPSVGAGLPALVACLGIAALVAAPELRRPAPLAGLLLGGVAASAVYLGLRPTTWTDATSTGQVITLPLPLDLTALAYVGLLGALGGLVLGGAARHRRRA